MIRRLNENKYKTGKIITSFSNYVRFINESYSFNAEEVNRKIRRVILWININQGFYGELLSHVNIFGSYDLDPKTMCTNGRDIIFHPEFVMNQTEAALRLVLCHEILHCIGDHGKRRGNRDPQGWNIACDYAINPLLQGEAGLEWPVAEDGSRAGLYEPRFEGMRAEDIYQQLEDEGIIDKLINDPRIKKQTDTGKVEDDDKESPEPDPDMVIQEGDFPKEDDEEEEDSDDIPVGGDGPTGDGPTGDGPTGDGPTGDGPTGDGPTGDGPTGDGPTGDGPTGDGPTGDGPTGDGPGDQPGEPGDEPGDQPGDQPGEPGDDTKDSKDPKDNKKALPKVGQKVITRDGKEGTITRVYSNGDIEIN